MVNVSCCVPVKPFVGDVSMAQMPCVPFDNVPGMVTLTLQPPLEFGVIVLSVMTPVNDMQSAPPLEVVRPFVMWSAYFAGPGFIPPVTLEFTTVDFPNVPPVGLIVIAAMIDVHANATAASTTNAVVTVPATAAPIATGLRRSRLISTVQSLP